MARERVPRPASWGRWALLAGIVLLAASFIVRDVRARAMVGTDRIAFGLMIAGLVLAVGGAVLNARTMLGILRGRRTLEGVNFAVVVFLFLALAGLFCYISTRWFTRMDWTGKRTYSLHSKTRNILRGLDRDVEAVVVIEPTVNPNDQRALDMAQDLLDEFKASGSHLSVRTLNWTTPEGQQQLQQLTQRMGGEQPPRFCVVFLTSDSHEVVPFDSVFHPTPAGLQFTGEDAFAAALTKLTENKKATVYFLTGHGERPFETEEPNPMAPQPTADGNRPELSLSRMAKALRGDNYDVKALNLASEGSVPDDCAVLIIAGPKAPLSDAELTAIRTYLNDRDGCVVALVDPLAVSVEPSNLNDLIGAYGLKARTDAIGITNLSTPLGVLQQDEILVTADGLAHHPITSGLENYNISPRYACPIEVDESAAPPGSQIVKLLSGSKGSWGETDYKPGSQEPCNFDRGRDVPPPLVVAALVTPRAPAANPMMPPPTAEPPGPKLLVVGSSLAFVNAMVDQDPANRYFLMNAVNWMGGKLHMLGIPPKTLETSEVTPTDAQLRAGRYVFVAIFPAFVVAVGVSVWLVRRKRR
jgi:hypothetical protein